MDTVWILARLDKPCCSLFVCVFFLDGQCFARGGQCGLDAARPMFEILFLCMKLGSLGCHSKEIVGGVLQYLNRCVVFLVAD